jgi:GntR family transcriptional regulator
MTLRRGSIPLYYQIREALRDRIVHGDYGAGDQLPTEAELCEHFEVSLTTVRRALSGLTREGLVERTSGKGTFVRQLSPEWELGPLTSFSQEMQRRNLSPGSRLVKAEIVEADPRIIEALRLSGNRRRVFCLERIRLVCDDPFMIETAYLPIERFPKIEDIDWTENISLLHTMLETYHVPLIEIQDVIEPAVVTEQQAELLGIRAFSLALHIESSLYTLNNELFQFSDAIVSSQRSRYLVHMKSHQAATDESSPATGRGFVFAAPQPNSD